MYKYVFAKKLGRGHIFFNELVLLKWPLHKRKYALALMLAKFLLDKHKKKSVFGVCHRPNKIFLPFLKCVSDSKMVGKMWYSVHLRYLWMKRGTGECKSINVTFTLLLQDASAVISKECEFVCVCMSM